jgi:hypothetical protein
LHKQIDEEEKSYDTEKQEHVFDKLW